MACPIYQQKYKRYEFRIWHKTSQLSLCFKPLQKFRVKGCALDSGCPRVYLAFLPFVFNPLCPLCSTIPPYLAQYIMVWEDLNCPWPTSSSSLSRDFKRIIVYGTSYSFQSGEPTVLNGFLPHLAPVIIYLVLDGVSRTKTFDHDLEYL